MKRAAISKKLGAVLWAGLVVLAVLTPGMALAIGEPIPGIDIVVKKNPPGMVVTISANDAGVGTFELGAGQWTAQIECSRGVACTPHFFTEVRVNGRRFVLPGPTEELDLRLGDAPGSRTVALTICENPCDGVRGLGGGRYTFIPTVVISAEDSGDERDARLGTVPVGDGGGGDNGGSAGGGGGGAGSP